MLKKYYIRTYGCQMNVADSEIVDAILTSRGYVKVEEMYDADIVLFNTCSIRENAERTLLFKLDNVKGLRRQCHRRIVVGILGCMGQLQGEKLLQHEQIDFIAGPDEYRKLPDIISSFFEKESYEKELATQLSTCETYSDISPLYGSAVSAFIPITRGCNNFCSYCVVPYTRGRERSRDVDSICREIRKLSDGGCREVTLLGQNVDSYNYNGCKFAQLLDIVANVDKHMRIRFLSSHPKDFTKDVVDIMSQHANICKYIHLPVQSGSNKILKAMNRPYTCEDYLAKVKMIRDVLGEGVAISTDLMCGFCGETENDHKETLSLMEEVKFDYSFTFAYSERKGTYSAEHMNDDVDVTTKKKRIDELIELQCKHSLLRYKQCIGKEYEILVEGASKRNKDEICGRTDTYKMVVCKSEKLNVTDFIGKMIKVKITDCTSATLIGECV